MTGSTVHCNFEKAKISNQISKSWAFLVLSKSAAHWHLNAYQCYRCMPYNAVKVFMVSCLDTLITGARRHPATMKVIRNIVNEIFMIRGDTFHCEHLLVKISIYIVLNYCLWKLSNNNIKYLEISDELYRRHISQRKVERFRGVLPPAGLEELIRFMTTFQNFFVIVSY